MGELLGKHGHSVRTTQRLGRPGGLFLSDSPPDGHHFLAGDGLGEKAIVVAAAQPALVTDAARARLQVGRGLWGGRLLQLLQEEGERHQW